MNEIKIFENEEFGKVRTVEIDGKIYFVATDIAKALGYTRPADAVAQHCRYTVKRSIPHPQSPEKQIEVNVIPEGDTYRLITHSKLKSAERFEIWVFDEVLPTLRKEGCYTMPGAQATSTISEQTHELISAIVIEVVTTFKSQLKEEIKEELRSEIKNRPFNTAYVDRPSPSYAIPQVFERMAASKAKEIARMYGATELESLSCIYRRMNMLGVDFSVVADRTTAINPMTASSVLKQIAVLPAYRNAFFSAAEEILNA